MKTNRVNPVRKCVPGAKELLTGANFSLLIFAKKILTPARWIEDAALFVKNGKVAWVGEKRDCPHKKAGGTLRFKNAAVVPGLIDLHIHGAGGLDLLDASESNLPLISKTLVRFGVTGYLATLCAAPEDKLNKALSAIAAHSRKKQKYARLLGIHLEGPFLNKSAKGAMDERCFHLPSIPLWEKFWKASRSRIKVVTLAPELTGSGRLTKEILSKNVRVSFGHSLCTFEQAMRGFSTGVSQVTHCGNAMGAFHQRSPGLLGAAFCNRNVSCEVIADGVHLHPALVQILLRTKGISRLLLVTDAMSALGCGNGAFSLGGRKVLVRGSHATLEDGTLAGAVTPLLTGVKNLSEWGPVSFQHALYCATVNPARAIGLHSKGRLDVGCDADMAVLDSKRQVIATAVGGKVVYRSS